jgi:hypothetical protein
LPVGATDTQITEFEMRNGVLLPPDMKRYFRRVNGMGPREQMDSGTYSFWDLDLGSVVPILDALGGPNILEVLPEARTLFVFADYCIGMQHFCIDLLRSSNPILCITSEAELTRESVVHVCETFTAIVELYLEGSFPFM